MRNDSKFDLNIYINLGAIWHIVCAIYNHEQKSKDCGMRSSSKNFPYLLSFKMEQVS